MSIACACFLINTQTLIAETFDRELSQQINTMQAVVTSSSTTSKTKLSAISSVIQWLNQKLNTTTVSLPRSWNWNTRFFNVTRDAFKTITPAPDITDNITTSLGHAETLYQTFLTRWQQANRNKATLETESQQAYIWKKTLSAHAQVTRTTSSPSSTLPSLSLDQILALFSSLEKHVQESKQATQQAIARRDKELSTRKDLLARLKQSTRQLEKTNRLLESQIKLLQEDEDS